MVHRIGILLRIASNPLISIKDFAIWSLLNLLITLEALLKVPRLYTWPLLTNDGYNDLQHSNPVQSDIDFDHEIQILNWEEIFEKHGILTRISEELTMSARLNGVVITNEKFPSQNVGLIHQIYFRTALPIQGIRSTMMVTHIDTFFKKRLLIWLQKRGVTPIFLSNAAAQLYSRKDSDSPEKFVIPLPPMQQDIRRKLKIGFLTNLYPDGRKREELLFDALKKCDTDWIHLKLIGEGLGTFASECEKVGIEVSLAESFDEILYAKILQDIDLLVYTGVDEGSISMLDAIKAGIPVVVPKIGANRMIDHKKVNYFDNSEDLSALLSQIIIEKVQLSESLPTRNFSEYFYSHALVWKHVLSKV